MKKVERVISKWDKIADEERNDNLEKGRFFTSLMYHNMKKVIFDKDEMAIVIEDGSGDEMAFLVSMYKVNHDDEEIKEEKDS